MKTCNKCQTDKPLSAFAKRKDRKGQLQTYCKECNREYQRGHYRRNKADYKEKAKAYDAAHRREFHAMKEGRPCMDCGQNFPHYVMDWDHRPGETKVDGVSNMVAQGRGKSIILAEIDKCDLVCSNCHRIRTHKRRMQHTALV